MFSKTSTFSFIWVEKSRKFRVFGDYLGINFVRLVSVYLSWWLVTSLDVEEGDGVISDRAVFRQNWSKFRQICVYSIKNSDNKDVSSSKLFTHFLRSWKISRSFAFDGRYFTGILAHTLEVLLIFLMIFWFLKPNKWYFSGTDFFLFFLGV